MSSLQSGLDMVRVPVTKESDEDLKQIVENNLDDTPQCTLCHYVVSYLDAILKNNKSQAAVEEALARVCSILPRKERPQCDAFIKSYGPALAELIAEVADPTMICSYLGMCQVVVPQDTMTKKSVPITYPNHDYVELLTKTSPFTCTICQFVADRMKQLIALNQTEQEILASLKDSCRFFTALDLYHQCLDFVNQYAPYIIKMISNDIEPQVACQNLKLCPKKDLSSPSAIDGKCQLGISYWCTSRENAELCNAVKVCERQVWSKQNKNSVI